MDSFLDEESPLHMPILTIRVKYLNLHVFL